MAAQPMTFRQYLSSIKQHGFLQIKGVSAGQLKRWMGNEDKWKQICSARDVFLRNQPQPIGPSTPQIGVVKAAIKEESDANSTIFESKILPRIEADVLMQRGAPEYFYTEATLAAVNLPGWADTLARYARADLKPFFVELGKAIGTKRRLWDKVDEFIAHNYSSTTTLKKPLSEMTEKDASKEVGLSAAAYDRRLLRLGIRKKAGRPKKRDKISQ